MTKIREERLVAKVFQGPVLLFTAALPVDMTLEQVMTWGEELQSRGYQVCWKRLPWPCQGEDPCTSWGRKAVRP